MKKTLTIIVFILVLVFGGMLYVMYSLNNSHREPEEEFVRVTEYEVMLYLKTKGYNEEDIQSIEVTPIAKTSEEGYESYEAGVEFSDESNATYFYGYDGQNIHQFGHNGGAEKHLE